MYFTVLFSHHILCNLVNATFFCTSFFLCLMLVCIVYINVSVCVFVLNKFWSIFEKEIMAHLFHANTHTHTHTYIHIHIGFMIPFITQFGFLLILEPDIKRESIQTSKEIHRKKDENKAFCSITDRQTDKIFTE